MCETYVATKIPYAKILLRSESRKKLFSLAKMIYILTNILVR